MMRGLYGAFHPIRTMRARRMLLRSDELVWLRHQEAKIAARDGILESPAADRGVGGDFGSDCPEEDCDSGAASRWEDGGQPPAAAAPSEVERELVSGEERTASASRRQVCSRQPHCVGIIGLAGVLLVLGAGRLKSASRKSINVAQ
ncbi:hypothetical protein BW737_002160 [Actinomyces ruminis]|uniref:Uncharacterized protein n=2 Tax=Actinomyces ruminis TaxID=1937003 RepID=A0ABX4MDC9_9ACTO|nr:hypothetical protein BW737_002160 [Actinomyces ruminis]